MIYQCLITFILCLHRMLTNTCTLDTAFNVYYCLIISTHIYLSLHDIWHSPEYLLWSFWLPWTCMFRFWRFDWSGALNRRSSLSLGAGRLSPSSFCSWVFLQARGTFSQLVSTLLTVQIVILAFVPGCDIMYMYQYIVLCNNFVILMLECIYATCFRTLLLACTDA